MLLAVGAAGESVTVSMLGAVFSTVTPLEVRPAPYAAPSNGVAVHVTSSSRSKCVPVRVAVSLSDDDDESSTWGEHRVLRRALR
jgi:hypothetical protein